MPWSKRRRTASCRRIRSDRLLLVAPHLLERGRVFPRALSCDAECLGKVVRIEPLLRLHGFGESLLPDAVRFNVELHVELLVDCLDSIAGDGPLFPQPVDVPMQYH